MVTVFVSVANKNQMKENLKDIALNYRYSKWECFDFSGWIGEKKSRSSGIIY